jgi:hypothetical protein
VSEIAAKEEELEDLLGEMEFTGGAAVEEELEGGAVRRRLVKAQEDIFKREPGGAGNFDKGINGHLGSTRLNLAIVTGSDIGQLRKLPAGELQASALLPEALAKGGAFLFRHCNQTPFKDKDIFQSILRRGCGKYAKRY